MRIRRLALVGAAALLLAGCGGSEESGSGSPSGSSSESGSELSQKKASEVVDASFAALEESGAARVVGSIEEGGSTQELDLQLQGDDTSGSITIDGVSVQLLSTAGQAFLQAPVEFWTMSGMPAEIAEQIQGQWVILPPEAAASFGTLTLSGLLEQLRSTGGEGMRGKVTTDELEGEAVVVVTQPNGSTFTARDDDESPYPLRIDEKGEAPASIEFSGFGEPVEIAAPTNPVDLNTLGG